MFSEDNIAIQLAFERVQHCSTYTKASNNCQNIVTDSGASNEMYRLLPSLFCIDKLDYIELSRALKSIYTAQNKIIRAVLERDGEKRFLERLGVSVEYHKYVKWDNLYHPKTSIARADVVPTTENYKVVELNIHPGVGGFICSEAYSSLSGTLGLRLPQKCFSAFDILAEHLKTRSEGYKRLVFVDLESHQSKGYPKFESMRDAVQRVGFDIPVYACTDKTMNLEWLEGDSNTLFYRGFSIDEIADDNEEFFWRILSQGANLINGLEDEIRTNKLWLAYLHDTEFQKLLTKGEVQAINEYIPKTKLFVREDIPVYLKDKSKLIFKKVDGFAGQSIYIGGEIAETDLEDVLCNLKTGSFIVQNFHEPVEFDSLIESGRSVEPAKFVLGLFSVNDSFGGMTIRASNTSKIVNISSGVAKIGWCCSTTEVERKGIITALEGLTNVK